MPCRKYAGRPTFMTHHPCMVTFSLRPSPRQAPWVWKDVDLSGAPQCYDSTDSSVASVVALASRARVGGPESLDLRGCIHITDTALVSVAETCPGLKSLQIDGTAGFRIRQVTQKGVSAVVKSCTALEILALRCCFFVNDAAVQAVAAEPHCVSGLRHLDLTGCHMLTGDAFDAIRSLTALESLHMGSCRSSTPDAMGRMFLAPGEFADDDGDESGGAASDSDERDDAAATSAAAGAGAAASAAAVRSSSGSRSARPRHHAKLRDLTLGHLSVPSSVIETAMQATGASLRSLDLRGCTLMNDDALAAVARHAPKLEDLRLAIARDVTSRGLARALDTIGATLKRLDVIKCRMVRPAIVPKIARVCPVLEHLDLGVAITAAHLSAIAASPCAPHLRVLRLNGSRLAHDEASATMTALVDAASSLVDLQIYETPALDVAVALRALRGCPHLARFDLRGCPAACSALLVAILDTPVACERLSLLLVDADNVSEDVAARFRAARQAVQLFRDS